MVAVATRKLDGLFFILGVAVGVFLFGETVSWFNEWWNSTSMGRFTLFEWLGLAPGVVVVLVVLMALFMFWGGEKLEAAFGEADVVARGGTRRRKLLGGVALIAVAALVMVIGQPSARDRWERIAPEKEVLLCEREVQIHPGELIELARNPMVKLILLDVRNEAEYNLFHIVDASRVEVDDLANAAQTDDLLGLPDNSVIVLMSNDEELATEAWKLLTAQSVLNVYILEGGINNWLDLFGHLGHERCSELVHARDGRTLRHVFDAAVGADQPSADPDVHGDDHGLEYAPKVMLQKKKVLGGGCG